MTSHITLLMDLYVIRYVIALICFVQDVEAITKILLHKTGESNSFIREAAEKALDAMVENVTPQKALLSLVMGGHT